MNNQVFEYNGNAVTFQLGNGDVMVNATQMAKPFNKQPHEYLRLPSTNELVKAITGKSRIDENQLVTTIRGGSNPGTWMHEDIALDFAQWLSVDFRLWCLDRIKELVRFGITATQPTIDTILDDPDNAIRLLQRLKEERAEKERLAEEARLQREQLQIAAPKVQYFDQVLMSQSTYTTNQIAKELGMSAVTLNRKMSELRIQYRQNGQWLLYSKYQNMGLTKTHTHTFYHSDGTMGTSMQTVWTEAGRKMIHEQIK